MVNFSQINLHKASAASILAGQSIEKKKQSILMLTEPHTVHSKVVSMPSNSTLIYDRKCPPGGPPPRAAIVASPDLKVNPMDSWCSRDCAVGMAKIHGKQTLLVSLYCDIKAPVISQTLDKLVDMCTKKGLPVLICMDSNAHSDLFGPDSNARGEELEDFILSNSFYVENIGETPTFETMRGTNLIQSHIDVTLSRDLHFQIDNWRVDRSYNASDHNSVLFSCTPTPITTKKIRPWKRADWPIFTEELKTADYGIPETMSMKKLDRLVTQLYRIQNKALDRACPEITVDDTARQNLWSTDKHETAKNKVSKLYSKAKQSGLQSDWASYKAEDKAFKKMCLVDKNKAWRKYKETLQSEKDMAALARLAQRQERREVSVLKKSDGTATDPGKETISLLTSTHFPAATSIKKVVYNNRRNATVLRISEKYTDWITRPLLIKALTDFEKKKSPGPDGIKPIIFEHLPVEFLDVLELAYKSAIHLAYTPKLWKHTKVIFISKPGKDTYDTPKAFRPISLSNYFLKGLERLVGWNMDKALLTNPIHHKQHGFLVGKSTESAISNTTNYIEKFIMKKQHCVGVFLDISSAFDSITAGHIRRSLLEHGGDPEMVQWYHDYITHRDIGIDLHGEMSTFSTGVGFPQGGVCSAKFWLIAFDTAIQIINTLKIEGNGYADDCSALFGGRRIDHAVSRLQRMLDRLVAWGKTCGLSFNPEKSVAVLFTRSRKTAKKKLFIDGKEIAYQSQVKYLGVTLDSKLHWTPHIKDKISKAKRFITQVAAITKKNWGPKPKLMRWAYLGIVRPMLCYGAMIWGHRAKFWETKLRRINRMAMNTFGSFPRSTPTAALEVMLDVMPLHLHCQKEGIAARLRLDEVLTLDWDGRNQNKTHCISHMRFWEEKLKNHDLSTASSDRCTTTKWSAGYHVNRESFNGASKHRCLTQFNVFTDGSRMNEQTGAGYVIYNNRSQAASGFLRLPDHATVFQAEITAVDAAANALAALPTTNIRYVKFFIDSQAAIQALGNPCVRSKAVGQAIDSLNNLSSKATRVSLVWIPAHKGHFGNTLADDLAKRGAGDE